MGGVNSRCTCTDNSHRVKEAPLPDLREGPGTDYLSHVHEAGIHLYLFVRAVAGRARAYWPIYTFVLHQEISTFRFPSLEFLVWSFHGPAQVDSSPMYLDS